MKVLLAASAVLLAAIFLMLAGGSAYGLACNPIVSDCATQAQRCGTGPPPIAPGGKEPPPTPACTYCECGATTYVPAGDPCQITMATVCTTATCDANHNCDVTNPTGGSVCGSACIAPGTCCDSSGCTSLDVANGTGVCSGPGGSCSLQCNSGYTLCGGACIPNGTCCTNASCSGGQQCSGPGGSCGCPSGQYSCGGTCIANSTCCASPNNCSQPTNGTASCPGNGGTCAVTCTSGYVPCGGACALCCTDADCTQAPANEHGVCGSGGCSYQCNANFKICGSTCIPTSQCCSSQDCTTPPNGCYKSTGTCTNNACAYAYSDGASCNADNNACTPNDACKSGTCIADTAHTVTCVDKDCQNNMGCNTTSGNCVYSNKPDTTACGANGCNSGAGTCTNGTCSAPPKDCTSLDTDCTSGACNASAPVGAPCVVTNKMNGTTCGNTNRCVANPICTGGVCGGAMTTCTASGACRNNACDPTTGSCSETIAGVGTSCDATCVQNAMCDSNGNCGGDPVPDGTPCDDGTCTLGASCSGGKCACIGAADFGASGIMLPDSGTMTSKHKGCSFTDRSPDSSSVPWPFFLLLLSLLHLRRRTS